MMRVVVMLEDPKEHSDRAATSPIGETAQHLLHRPRPVLHRSMLIHTHSPATTPGNR